MKRPRGLDLAAIMAAICQPGLELVRPPIEEKKELTVHDQEALERARKKRVRKEERRHGGL